MTEPGENCRRRARPAEKTTKPTGNNGYVDIGLRAQPSSGRLTPAAGGPRPHLPAARAVPRPDGPDEGRLGAVEAQSPAHLVLVHDRVGVAARDAGVVG